MKRLALLPVLVVVGVASAAKYSYPQTRTVDVVDELHGERIADPYRWLEDNASEDVLAWTKRQNALTERLLGKFTELRAELRTELEKLYFVPTTGLPGVYGDRYFFSKREADENHAVLFVRRGRLDAEQQVVIDPNTFSDDGTVAMDWYVPSPDGKLIVYGKSADGSEQSTLYLRDVDSATDLALVIPHTRHASISWDPDGRGFHYSRYPEPGTVPEGDERYFRRIYYHKFGTDWRNDPLVFGADTAKEAWNGIGSSSDHRYQFLTTSVDWTKNDMYIRPMGGKAFTPVAVGLDGSFGGDVLGDELILLTNYAAPRYRVIKMPVNAPQQANWQTVVPEGEGVIRGMTLAGGKIVLHVIENAYSRLRIYEPDGTLFREIELPTLGSVGGMSGRPEHPELYFGFSSFAYPSTSFKHNIASGEQEIIDRIQVEGIDFDAYETQQVWFESKDGTRVPMFVVNKRGIERDGDNPTLLYGYGGFNGAQTPFFWRSLFGWLDRGGVFALVNARGGGEFGKEWHLAGRGPNKQNTFDDFIAAGEKLIAGGWTKSARLGLRGGSNGGLVVGAVFTQRPELFRAVICGVPLLDMLRYHKKEIARLWIPEYGDPDKPEDFRWLRSYSPYHNVEDDTAYPAVLFTAGASDSRVDPMHARKMTAAMQAATTADRPILLRVEMKGGHGAGQPMSLYIDKQLDYWTFLMWQLGMVDE